MAEKLLVADSFRVRATEAQPALVRGWDRHRARFCSAVKETVGQLSRTGTVAADDAAQFSPERIERFLTESTAAISGYGEGMPRLELLLTTAESVSSHSEAAPGEAAQDRAAPGETTAPGKTARAKLSLNCNLRPLPPLQKTQAIVATRALTADEYRGDPHTKGPNIALFKELTEEAGGEVLLLTGEGDVLETTTAAVLWWSGETLCRVDNSRRVPSVTEQLVTECVSELGYQTARATVTPAALAAHEVWVVNALHGIRPVTQLGGVAAVPFKEARLERIRQALDTTWQPL